MAWLLLPIHKNQLSKIIDCSRFKHKLNSMTTISIKIKHGTDQIEVIEIDPNLTVKELKEKLTPKFNTEPS